MCDIIASIPDMPGWPGNHTAQVLGPAPTHLLSHSWEKPKWNQVADTKKGGDFQGIVIGKGKGTFRELTSDCHSSSWPPLRVFCLGQLRSHGNKFLWFSDDSICQTLVFFQASALTALQRSL